MAIAAPITSDFTALKLGVIKGNIPRGQPQVENQLSIINRKGYLTIVFQSVTIIVIV